MTVESDIEEEREELLLRPNPPKPAASSFIEPCKSLSLKISREDWIHLKEKGCVSVTSSVNVESSAVCFWRYVKAL